MNELETYINSYFGLVELNEIRSISEFFKPALIKKGEYFLKAGAHCRKLGFVQSGLLRMYAGAGNKEVTQWISGKGHFATDLASFVFDVPGRWNIQALTDTEVAVISKEDYQGLGRRVPRWHELEKLFIARCFTQLEDRIFSHLSMTAEERYQLLFDHSRELFQQVPLQYLASMLGMTPETFSRVRKKLAR